MSKCVGRCKACNELLVEARRSVCTELPPAYRDTHKIRNRVQYKPGVWNVF